MNEAEIRDPALAAAGWGVVEGSRVRRDYPLTLGRLEGQGRRGKAAQPPITCSFIATPSWPSSRLRLGTKQ